MLAPVPLPADRPAPDAVAFHAATLRLGARTVLSDVELAIRPGEFVGVLGPNGAGKTTLMRAVLGLVRPAAGQVRVLGEAPSRGNRAVGYMPQVRARATLALQGRAFVAAAAGGHRWGLPLPSAAERADVDQALELVGATALARRSLGELSGGERQRLLLAQALLGQPRLLLLDEPLASLDPRHQDGVVALTRDICRRLGIAVLFSAHELNPLLGALDRVLYLGGGHAALGTVEEVVTGPVLSRLYGTPIDVVHLRGRVFVMSGGHDVERGAPCGPAHHHAAGGA